MYRSFFTPKRRAVAVAVSVALVATGCSSAGDTSGTTKLKMVFEPGPEADAMAVLVKDFNATAGKTDKVAVQIIQLSRTDTFAKEATVMATKSSEYDIYRTTSYLVAQHAPYLDPITLNESEYFPTAVNSLKVKGKLYGIPLDVSNHFLFYRQDLIAKMLADPAGYAAASQKVLGLSLTPKDPAEWNWNDYIASAAYFTKSVNPLSPTQYGTVLAAKNLSYNAMIWDDVLWSFGGSWTDSSGKAALTSEVAEKAVRVYSKIYTSGITSPDSTQAEFPETQAGLTAGNAAFAVQWGAGYAALADAATSPVTAGKIGIAPVPGETHATHVHALSIGINKYGKHKAQAKTFIDWLSSSKTMTKYVKAGGIAAMPKVLEANASTNAIFADISSSVSKYGFAEPNVPRAFDIYTALAADLSGAWVGEGNPKDALKKANESVAALLK
ncbi:MAG: extracellular solute-binding protein [Microbacteriaceae bacterium]|nr:extracellular solute-binding protein [Microbacteriaceae bacterium]